MSTTITQVQNYVPPHGRLYAQGSLSVGPGCESTGEESSRVSTHAESFSPELVNLAVVRNLPVGACDHSGTASGDPGGAMADEEESFDTISRLVQGSIVTYTAGLDVLSLTTGFESCTFLIDNIPEDANGAEVLALFARGGLDVDQFYLVGMRTAGAGRLNAVVVADAKAGGNLIHQFS
ncbi:hypothetical protein EDC04DRAFT_2721559 [Pisolithus marmoratus]|nr:hypothetical protein EDC04DRAFT_2721559 [Pisolithus marmoratus]